MAHILVIDDEALLRDMLRRSLEKSGHVVTLAADGTAGLAAQKVTAFDLVITDLVMPGKEGIETIIELKRRAPQLKIIAMSGGGTGKAIDYLAIATRLGATCTLTKPFSLEQMTATVTELLQAP